MIGLRLHALAWTRAEHMLALVHTCLLVSGERGYLGWRSQACTIPLQASKGHRKLLHA